MTSVLYGKIVSETGFKMRWSSTELLKEDGWYEIDREPDLLIEYPEYDPKQDTIVFIARPPSAPVETALEKLEKRVVLLEQAAIGETP